jgi:hypothetical protein
MEKANGELKCERCQNVRALDAGGVCAVCRGREAQAVGTFDPNPPAPRTVGVQAVDEAAARQVPVEPPAGPKVLAELHVVLYDDGHFQVNGPFDDPFRFHGLLGVATDALRDVRARAAQQAGAVAATKGPGFLRKVLERTRLAQGILRKS